MKLANILFEGAETAAVIEEGRCFPLTRINQCANTNFPVLLWTLIAEEKISLLSNWFARGWYKQDFIKECSIDYGSVTYLPPYRHPEKIWGVGLNFTEHARDLSVPQPEQFPAGFNKPPTTIIGHNENIIVPGLSGTTTAESELGIILGKQTKNIEPQDWKQYVAGFVPVIDVTSLDILKQNPRYLSLSKSFDTYFSFGPVIYTPDEITDIDRIRVETWHNNKMIAANTVDHMRFSPEYLVSFLSRVFVLKPGDIISTGTPGAVEINDGDIVEARISGLSVLRNSVKKS